MFEHLTALPPDPILRLLAEQRQDNNPQKIDLGVGVYKDAKGATPIMQAVDRAERILLETENTKTYVAPAGNAGFNSSMAKLLMGSDNPVLESGRLTVAQTPGGCGALRMAAEFLNLCKPGTRVWLSDPSWANHNPLLNSAGLETVEYPYYDYENCGIRFDAMMDKLESEAKAGDVVLLHGCCHNPSGADLNQEQWQQVTELCLRKGLLPFIDIAYQGLGDGLDEDAYGVRLMAEKMPELVITASCSKNFGLYRERTGAVMLLSSNADNAAVAASRLFSIIRGCYSMPPSHGASVVDLILASDELTTVWQDELAAMRQRIHFLRGEVVSRFAAAGVDRDFGFIQRQSGMFSFLGITPEQVQRLKQDFSIYMVNSSRINVAGLSENNLDYFVSSVAQVLKS